MNLSESVILVLATLVVATQAFADKSLGGALSEHDGRKLESIVVMSFSTAQCTLRRDGKTLALVTIPETGRTVGMSETVAIDVTQSTSQIIVICKVAGQAEVVKAFTFQPVAFYVTGPACVSKPEKATAADKAEANQCQRARAGSYSITEYPEVMRVYGLRPNAH